MKCSIASGSISSQKPVFFSLTLQSRSMIHRHTGVPTRFLINQCQIMIFLILKSDIIENSRIELTGIVLPVPSNQIKVTLLLFYPSVWYICEFFLFHIKIEGKGGWIIGGRSGQRVCCPPPPPPNTHSNYWGGLAHLPPPTPTFFLCLCHTT